MAKATTTIDDRLWEKIAHHLPKMKKRQGSAGRFPSWTWREILEAIFWILRTGAPWSALPECFPPKSTVPCRFLMLVRSGFFQRLSEEIAQELYDKGVLDLSECYLDGTFVSGKRGGEAIGKTKRGKGSKIMAICDKNGRPAGITVTSASPHEVTLVHATIDNMFVDENPEHLVGDGAYDSDPLDQELQEEGIEMVAPHKKIE
jgi:transposase